MNVIFYDDMFMSLNFGFTAWTASREVWEEYLFIFSNRGIC